MGPASPRIRYVAASTLPCLCGVAISVEGARARTIQEAEGSKSEDPAHVPDYLQRPGLRSRVLRDVFEVEDARRLAELG